MRRRQFSLKTLLWLTVVVAAFCAGWAIEHRARIKEREGVADFLDRVINRTDP